MNVIDCLGNEPKIEAVRDLLKWQIATVSSNHNGAYRRVLNVVLYARGVTKNLFLEELTALAYKFYQYALATEPPPVDFTYRDLCAFVGILGNLYHDKPDSLALLQKSYEGYLAAPVSDGDVHNSIDVIKQNILHPGESTLEQLSAETFEEGMEFISSRRQTFLTFQECVNDAFAEFFQADNVADKNKEFLGYAQKLVTRFTKTQHYIKPYKGKIYFANRQVFPKMGGYIEALSQY